MAANSSWGTSGPFYGTGYYGMFHGHGHYDQYIPNAVAGPYGPRFEVMSDDAIEQIVYDSLEQDPVISPGADIHVEVHGGVVTLSGEVPSAKAKHAADYDAAWIPAVIDVDNNVSIRLPF